jgi:bacteriorhodopsin
MKGDTFELGLEKMTLLESSSWTPYGISTIPKSSESTRRLDSSRYIYWSRFAAWEIPTVCTLFSFVLFVGEDYIAFPVGKTIVVHNISNR